MGDSLQNDSVCHRVKAKARSSLYEDSMSLLLFGC